jgi:hypothetical protein
MTDTAIARVEALGVEDEQPLIQEQGLVVEWRPNHPIPDDEYDHDYAQPANAQVDFALPDQFVPIDADEAADLLADNDVHQFAPPAAPAALDQGAHDDGQHFYNNDGEGNADNVDAAFEIHDDDEVDSDDEGDDDANANNDDDDNEGHPARIEEEDEDDDSPNDDSDDNGNDEGARESATDEDDGDDEGAHDTGERRTAEQPRYNLRERTGATHYFKDAMDNPHDGKSYFPPTQLTQKGIVDTIKLIYGKVMTQMTAKKGIKKFGQEAIAALLQEFSQMENLDVYEAVNAGLLTREQRRAALQAINLIKRKRDGTLKGRTVADGSVQRSLYDKVETASPTVATDALLLSILIDAHEGRDVTTADVAGAYLKAYMTDLVFMKFTGETVDILCKMNPRHTKFVVVEKGVKVLYVKLITTLYGCVKSALLWYARVVLDHAEGNGFRNQPV